MTPEQTIELAKQANEYADIEYERHWKSGLFVKEPWQSIRDKCFAELVRNATLEEAAKVCEKLANDKKVTQPQQVALDLASDAIWSMKK